MPDYLGTEQRKVKEGEKDDGPIRGLFIYYCKISGVYLASVYQYIANNVEELCSNSCCYALVVF